MADKMKLEWQLVAQDDATMTLKKVAKAQQEMAGASNKLQNKLKMQGKQRKVRRFRSETCQRCCHWKCRLFGVLGCIEGHSARTRWIPEGFC